MFVAAITVRAVYPGVWLHWIPVFIGASLLSRCCCPALCVFPTPLSRPRPSSSPVDSGRYIPRPTRAPPGAPPTARRSAPILGLVGLTVGWLLLADGASVYRVILCWLTFWVFQQMYRHDALSRGSFYVTLAYTLLRVCIGFFLSHRGLSFYMLFETSLLPTLLMVLLYGYQPEKLRASQYLLLYTVLASLPLLLSLLMLPPYLGWLSPARAGYLVLGLTLGFLVKSPLYLVHIWLPKAHVEAPVAARIVLAGILLKLGSYGLLLFCPLLHHPLLALYLVISLLGAVVCRLICARQ